MAIEIENLTKSYGSQKAVNDISFKINTGEVVGFLGPNGAGKSTTMKMITCFLAAEAGTIRMGEYTVDRHPEEFKKRIGYLPEDNPLYTEMAIIDYLRFCAEIQSIPSDQISERIASMIDVCGLEQEKLKKIGELSKGYRQRVGLAQAMIHDPEILVLDEPTSGLDPNQIIEIRKLIKKLGREKTVILSSHILSEVEATCDRILIINQGKIVADGTSSNLRQQASGQEVLTVQIETSNGADAEKDLRDLATVETVKPIEGKTGFFTLQSKPDSSSRKAVFDLCVRNKWYLLEMAGSETSLEDIFRELTN